MKNLRALTSLYLKNEWRGKSAFNATLIYLTSIILVCYLTFNLKVSSLNPIVWNCLLWIILLFVAINFTSNSFKNEQGSSYYYIYQLISPKQILFSKIVFNLFVVIILFVSSFILYSLVLGIPQIEITQFLVSLFLGSTSIVCVLTLVAAIASKTNNSTTLTAILGFPLMLPSILMSVKASANAIDGLSWSANLDEFLSLGAFSIISIALSYILFPYIWRS